VPAGRARVQEELSWPASRILAPSLPYPTSPTLVQDPPARPAAHTFDRFFSPAAAAAAASRGRDDGAAASGPAGGSRRQRGPPTPPPPIALPRHMMRPTLPGEVRRVPCSKPNRNRADGVGVSRRLYTVRCNGVRWKGARCKGMRCNGVRCKGVRCKV
jgi:hypothetical protein